MTSTLPGQTMSKPYSYKSCHSLFGYASDVHARSGGKCQLCGFGGRLLDFDLWRQLTVEHLIGVSQGGHRTKREKSNDISRAVLARFPDLPPQEQERLMREIDNANTVTACGFCNSATSRDKHTKAMHELINAPGTPEEVLAGIRAELQKVLEHKRAAVACKLECIRKAYEDEIAPRLQQVREST
jgi:hypothetical protein